MPTYQSNLIASKAPARVDVHSDVVHATFTIATALATNDLLDVCDVEKNVTIADAIVSSVAPGTQSGSDSTFELGDAGDTDRFITTAGGIVLRAAGGVARLNNPAGHMYRYAADTRIQLRIVAGGTGQTTGGVIRVTLLLSPQF